MPRVICCFQSGLFGGPLHHGGQRYMVESDGVLNPQPSPGDWEAMARFTAVFKTRMVPEARAARLDWPGWEVDPDDEPVTEPAAASKPEPVDYTAMSYNELRAYAKTRGVTSAKKVDILADLAELDNA